MQIIRRLYETASMLPPGEREAWLEREGADEAMRRRILRMIDTSTEDDPLSVPIDELAQALADEPCEPVPVGSRIGPFELAEVIGEGGTSTVYRGLRSVEGITHEVAVKLLHRNLHTASARREFRREQRVLVQLRHPNIASLIEGGVTDTGQPYIALELVRGEPITTHAQRHRLGLRARLERFLDVCAAVAAAHRLLIVHRDLKPSNVLVSADGDVKLLDFGIAKLLGDADDDATANGRQPFTPAYAAPEQRAGAPVGTATDIYALGVLLGELLCGQRFNDGIGGALESRIADDAAAGILAEPAPALRRRLRGDLGAIIQQAIAGDPARRYASAAELADDVRRLLDQRPVLAQAPTRWYRARRFVQRHRLGVAMTAALALGLLGALAAVTWQAGVARENAQRADAQARRAVAVRDFLVGLLDAAQARLPAGQKPTVDQLVEQARRQLAEAGASGDPALRADVLAALAMVGMTLGDYDDALAMLDEAASLKAPLYVPDDPERWSIDVHRANVMDRTGRRGDAEALLAPRLPAMRAHDGLMASEGLQVLAALVARREGCGSGQALALADAAVAKGLPWQATDSPVAFKLMAFPGLVHGVCGQHADEAARLVPIVARWRERGLPRNDDFATLLNNLGVGKIRSGDAASGEPLLTEAVDIERGIHPQSPVFATSLRNLAAVRMRLGRLDDAEAPLVESLAIVREAFEPDSPARVNALVALATLRSNQQRNEDAAALLHETRPPCAGTDAATEPGCARALVLESGLHLRNGDVDAAQATIERALALRGSREDAERVRILARFAQVHNARRQPAAAREAADRAIGIATTLGSENGAETDMARIELARARLTEGDVASSLAALEPMRARREADDAVADAQQFAFLALRALALDADGRPDDARRLADRAMTLDGTEWGDAAMREQLEALQGPELPL